MNSESITDIEKRLGYTFRDKTVLIRALTRKAFALEQKQQKQSCEDQEVYRVLGDAVLKAILVEMLIEDGCDSREEITTRKIELEKRESLGAKLREIQIAHFIRFSRGEQKQNISGQSSVLGETFEALIAAIHIDSGSYEITKKIVIKLFRSQGQNNSIKAVNKDDRQPLEAKTASKLPILYSFCNMCFQSDFCSKMGMCYFEITGDV